MNDFDPNKLAEEAKIERYCSGCNSSHSKQIEYSSLGKACCPDSDQKYILFTDAESLALRAWNEGVEASSQSVKNYHYHRQGPTGGRPCKFNDCACEIVVEEILKLKKEV